MIVNAIWRAIEMRSGVSFRWLGLLVGLLWLTPGNPAHAESLGFSTQFTLPVLITNAPEFPLFIQSPGTEFFPAQTGSLTIAFDAEDLVVTEPPDGVTARFLLPPRADAEGLFSGADVLVELMTATGDLRFGNNPVGMAGDPFFSASISITTGPVPRLGIFVEDFDGLLILDAFDPSGSTLMFGDLSNPVAAFSTFPTQLSGLDGTFRIFDQGATSVRGILTQQAPAQPIPEPASVALFMIGTIIVGRRLVSRRS